jgi:phospholipid/cholesterol/gamma-HCH transport system substrate-binding protein
MHLTPQYARNRIYHDATLLLRPKTALQDLTIEVSPGTPTSGALSSGATLPLSQTAPNIDFDEFLAGLDTESRAYLQELLAGAGEGLKGNGKALSAALKRFDPTARDLQEIGSQLDVRHASTAHAIHNFRLLIEALGGKDQQLSELVVSANRVFKTFAEEEQNVESTLHLLPATLGKAQRGLGKLATAARVLGPTLKELQPFAKALGPGEEASQKEFLETTPIIKSQIRPFARQILPVVNQIGPATKELSAAFPKLASSFSVLNELFNEFAYNPGTNKGGFLFYLAWGNHDFNSAVSAADAHGALGNVLPYFNCNVVPILKGAGEVNPTVRLLLGLLNAPSGASCSAGATVKAASARGNSTSSTGLFTGLAGNAFGQGRHTSTRRSPASASKAGG